ncbi:MAG: ComEC/Rec2 family competence protein [Patescibacteria group bacterium]
MKRGVYIFWSLFIAVALARFVFSLSNITPNIGDCLKQTVNGNGIVTEESTFTESGQTIVVQADELLFGNKSCPSGILIRMKTKLYPRFTYGNDVSFSGKLNEPFNFKSGTGRAFDYKGYLAKDDIYYEIKSAKVISNSEEKKGNSISSILFRLKRGFVNNLEIVLGEPHAALAAGLVVGEKSALGKDLLNDFRIVGLIHVVVLSGFNITIVADALRRMLSFLPRVWGITIGGAGITLFGILVGGGATVVRSCFMSGVALSADLIRRDYNVVRALGFAGLLMLIQNPSILLHDPSFQLSFIATLGLILLAKPIENHLTFIPERFSLRGTIATTFATQIFVSPLILYMMGQISIIGVIVNILILPFIPVTMLFVFLTGAVGFISFPLSQIIGWVAHFLLSYELFVVEHFARLPFAALYIPQFSGWWVAGFYAMFVLIYWRKEIFTFFSFSSLPPPNSS